MKGKLQPERDSHNMIKQKKVTGGKFLHENKCSVIKLIQKTFLSYEVAIYKEAQKFFPTS